jgi:hypothetical protein
MMADECKWTARTHFGNLFGLQNLNFLSLLFGYIRISHGRLITVSYYLNNNALTLY